MPKWLDSILRIYFIAARSLALHDRHSYLRTRDTRRWQRSLQDPLLCRRALYFLAMDGKVLFFHFPPRARLVIYDEIPAFYDFRLVRSVAPYDVIYRLT